MFGIARLNPKKVQTRIFMAVFDQTVSRSKSLTSLPLIGNDIDRQMRDDSRACLAKCIHSF